MDFQPRPLSYLQSLPPPWPEDLRPSNRARVEAAAYKLIAIDDDPTGCQTVHAVDLFTAWDDASLAEMLADPEPLAYLLTNSRALPEAQAADLARGLGAALQRASHQSGRPVIPISRSDSTLRGHYPAEVDALVEGMGEPCDALLLAPCFFEGGRYTLDDVHWVRQADQLIPAHQTAFAADPAFGFSSAFLPAWVEQKTRGRIRAGQVVALSLETLRAGGPAAVAAALGRLGNAQVLAVNAADYADLDVLVSGLLDAEAGGLRCLYRTAASFVRARRGLPAQPPLQGADLRCPGGEGCGGLVVAGSFVPQTTRQLQALTAPGDFQVIEVDVHAVMRGGYDCQLVRLSERVNRRLLDGKHVLICTSRQRLGVNGEQALAAGQAISSALVALVKELTGTPAFFIAKGGITASDIATRALRVHKARVLGQALSGVPVWRLGAESRFPGLPYVVFPGNVGDEGSLRGLVDVIITAGRQSP